MQKFWKREGNIEGALRALRSQPRREFEDGIVDRLRAAGFRSRSGIRVGALVALTAGMIALVGAFGGFSYAASGISSAQAVYNKVLICHKGHEINVDENAVPAFLSQGDTLGACPPGAFLPPVIGTGGNDNVKAGNGNVVVNAGGGDDTIKGGNGAQKLNGGDGNDTIVGGNGNQRLSGGTGDDKITAGKGHNVIYGGDGNDTIFAHQGTSDYVDGGPGVDTCHVDKIDIVKNCEKVIFS